MTDLQVNKINDLLLQHFNIFHADLIIRAIQDESLDRYDFIRGYVDITQSEKTDDDEFIPKGWEEV